MKWFFAFLIFISLNSYASHVVQGICETSSIASCQRQGEMAAIKSYEARHSVHVMSAYDDLTRLISEHSELQRRAQDESLFFDETSCSRHSPGESLLNLMRFIKEDFPQITAELLPTIPTDDLARMAKEDSIASCANQMSDKRRELFVFAKAAYEPDHSLAVTGLGEEIISYKGPTTDLSFYQARNEAGELIFSFAGTQNAQDWQSNLLYSGGDQLREAVDSALFNNAVDHVKNGGKINCTGHSLGGGLAEGFCLSVMARVKEEVPGFGHRLEDNRIHISTFNALGSRGMCMNPRMRKESSNTSRCGSPKSLDWIVSSADHVRIRGDFLQSAPPNIGSYMVGNITRVESDLPMRSLREPRLSVRSDSLFESPRLSVELEQTRCDRDPVNAHSLDCIEHAIAPVSRAGSLQRCLDDSTNAGFIEVPATLETLIENVPMS